MKTLEEQISENIREVESLRRKLRQNRLMGILITAASAFLTAFLTICFMS
jgi:hypothetical protein